MEKYETIESPRASSPPAGRRVFTVWILLTQALGLVAVIAVIVWLARYRGGFAWQSHPDLQFNYHPLFMVIGMVVLYGDALLAYRVFSCQRKLYVKLLHGSLHVLALLFAAVGLKAVFDSHNLAAPPVTNLYSLHSWLGLTTVILFALQWVGGVVAFLKPGLPYDMRSRIMPLHVFFGLALYVIAIATAISGLTEKAIFSKMGYASRSGEGILLNIIGVTLVLLGLSVVFVVTRKDYKRPPNMEDERIHLAD